MTYTQEQLQHSAWELASNAVGDADLNVSDDCEHAVILALTSHLKDNADRWMVFDLDADLDAYEEVIEEFFELHDALLDGVGAHQALLAIADPNTFTRYDFTWAKEVNKFLSTEPSEQELVEKYIEIYF